MTIQEKKNVLKQYRKYMLLIDRLKEKLNMLDEKSTSIKSPSFSAMPRGGEKRTTEDIIAEKQDLEERIKKLSKKARKSKKFIYDKLDEIEDVRYVSVLEDYFVNMLTMEDIAYNNGYSVRHTYRLYIEALKAINLECH